MIGRLGRSQRSTPDRKQLWLGRYVAPALYSAAPPFDDWTGSIRYSWFKNNELGCCTITAIAHIIEQRCALIGEKCKITDDDIVRAYARVTGYDGTPATDNGGQMRDALKYAQKYGIGGHKIGPYMAINVSDPNELRAALHSFGSVYIGGDLPKRITEQGNTWAIPKQTDARDRPRSLGGHAWMLSGYDAIGWWSMPWVSVTAFPDDWALTYLDEGYVFFDDLWATRTRVAPNGFDYDRLQHDMRQLAA